jgi:hypothetical protein
VEEYVNSNMYIWHCADDKKPESEFKNRVVANPEKATLYKLPTWA